jgi:adenylate cyclase
MASERDDPGQPRPLPPSDLDQLTALARSLGATEDEIASATNLTDLALDLNLRPRGLLTLGQLIDELDLGPVDLVRLAEALGLPTDRAQKLSPGEETTLRLFGAVSVEMFNERVTLRAARVTRVAMARIASTLIEGFRLQVEVPRRDAGTRYADVVGDMAEMTRTMLPTFVESLDAVLRNQILVVSKQMWSMDDERTAMTVERTVGFVDLVGYTALVESLSVGQLAELLADFDDRTADSVARWGGSIVKAIGDEVMFVAQDAGAACRIGLELVDRFGAVGELPVRVGLATGEMVSVLGDLFGTNVNLAARLVDVAEPGAVLVSDHTRVAVAGFEVEPLAPVTLKGFPHPVTAYRLGAGPGPGPE